MEATSIHGTIVQVLALSRLLLRKGGPLPDIGKARDEYNRLAARQLNDFRTFISTHYTRTRDEPFWIYARTECLDETARDIVARCAREMPRQGSFAPLPGNLPHVDHQLYYPVLNGLGHLERGVAKSHLDALPKVRAHARKMSELAARQNKQAAMHCLGHREFLDRSPTAASNSAGRRTHRSPLEGRRGPQRASDPRRPPCPSAFRPQLQPAIRPPPCLVIATTDGLVGRSGEKSGQRVDRSS